MGFGKALLVILGVLALGALVVGGCGYKGYHKAIAFDEDVEEGWAQVENQLQRRFELIPNLIATVKGVAGQEEKIFLGIAKSRESYFKASTPAQKAAAAGSFESALSRLLVLKESYPELKSNQSFLNLQSQLEGTENRLAVERKRYNDRVKHLNSFCRGITGSLYCGWADVEKAEYFEISDEARTAPKVDFSSDDG